MPRRPRLQVPGGIYHVTSRATGGGPLFALPSDLDIFLRRLEIVVTHCGWRCYAYCVLGTHYHLLIEVPMGNLAAGMHQLNSTYAQGFNRRHGRKGHLVEDRYYSGLVETDGHFLQLFRYFALNPVKAGLCADPADWRWSSYGAIVGARPRPPFLAGEYVLALFGGQPEAGQARLRDFVEDRLIRTDLLRPDQLPMGSDPVTRV